MKVYLLDDHSILIEGLVRVLKAESWIEVVGFSTHGQEALEFARTNALDVLVTDQSMPGLQGIDVIRKLAKINPAVRIVILTMHDELHLYREMLKEGVHGYVLKRDSERELINALRQVRLGNHYVSPVLAQAMENAPSKDEARLLTKREKEILRLIVNEKTNREIAADLFIR